jgi:formate dehydrogenase major subunit
MAMRGHASIQGSSDIPTLYEILPGYLPMPRATRGRPRRSTTTSSARPQKGWWSHFDKYIVSLLKAWFGDAATPRTTSASATCPKLTGNHSHFPTMLRALDGGLDGLFVMGQNPGRRLDPLGPAAARAGEPEVARRARPRRPRDRALLARLARGPLGRAATEDIETEVFLMPAAGHVEKEGHFTNTQRLLQWRDKAIDPPGDARSELHFASTSAARQGALRGLRARPRLADPQPHVGLPDARRRAEPTRRRCSRRSTATT